MLMRNDLRPLCPHHHAVMLPATLWLRFGNDLQQRFCFACAELACFSYDIEYGYFIARENEHRQSAPQWRITCPKDGLAMYIAQFEPQKSVRLWRCGQIGCSGSHRSEGS